MRGFAFGPVARVRVFMTFDVGHDKDLKKRLVEESAKASSGFEILGFSEAATPSDASNERVRRLMAAADEVIVICGEHTGDSLQVSAEVGIAQEQAKPYFLLWGRREVMCTRPIGSKPGDSMYTWTPDVIRDQVVMTLRVAEAREVPERCKKP